MTVDRGGAAAGASPIMQRVSGALRSGDRAGAVLQLRQHLLAQPNDALALAFLSDLMAEDGRLQESIMLLRRALGLAPQQPAWRIALARRFEQAGDGEAALAEIEASGPAMRGEAQIKAFEAAVLGNLGRHERELELYAELVGEQPGNAGLWMSYGIALKTVGRTKEAIAALRRAIKARPTYGEAYWSLANLKTFRFDERDIRAMRKALAGKLEPADALHFRFALGKALEDRGDAEGSFAAYDAGNRIRASLLPPGAMIMTPRVDAAIETFTPALFERFAGAGSKARDPIFVVGLQRSGSTLIEQILASHPEIEGTAELTVLEQIWERLGTAGPSGNPFVEVHKLSPEAIAALGDEYIERTRPYRHTDRPLFVDKLPANWLNSGLIRLILPNAKIVDARRSPMACGFSNFRQHYATGVTFAYSLESIGRFYADYVRLMRHIDTVQPRTVHRVINEQVIEDPEREVRRLLDYVGVPFDPACLEFHRNARPVHSASSEQVRRPINADGVDSWRPFEQWLGPLKVALGDAADRWDEAPA